MTTPGTTPTPAPDVAAICAAAVKIAVCTERNYGSMTCIGSCLAPRDWCDGCITVALLAEIDRLTHAQAWHPKEGVEPDGWKWTCSVCRATIRCQPPDLSKAEEVARYHMQWHRERQIIGLESAPPQTPPTAPGG